jgi:hypothetical protein
VEEVECLYVAGPIFSEAAFALYSVGSLSRCSLTIETWMAPFWCGGMGSLGMVEGRRWTGVVLVPYLGICYPGGPAA